MGSPSKICQFKIPADIFLPKIKSLGMDTATPKSLNVDTATSKSLNVDTATAKSPGMDTATARRGYSDAPFLLHRILHQKVRNVENLRGKICAFVLVINSLGG